MTRDFALRRRGLPGAVRRAGVKSSRSKPVVGVGRFTSPDTMVAQIRRGVLDLIGAARPSIADPFLPRKIEEGRIEDIRECIGCNICVTGDIHDADPLHAEPLDGRGVAQGLASGAHRAEERKRVLVVGAGPAGLEAAHVLGQRGYEVHLAEASQRARRPRRVAKRGCPASPHGHACATGASTQLQKMANVAIYRENDIERADVIEFGRGAHRARDRLSLAARRLGRSNGAAIPAFRCCPRVHAGRPDARRIPDGPVLLFDDDAFYIGSVMAEVLARARGAKSST